MKYGIIVCPKCKKAKGVLLTTKATSCPNCGKHLHLSKIKVFNKTNSQEQMRDTIGKINVNLSK